MIAISESTPGAIGINMSTYAGYITGGIFGGVLATLSLAMPSVIIILIIARLLEKFENNPYVTKAFYGLRPASIAMISAAGINVVKIALINLNALTDGSGLAGFFKIKEIIRGYHEDEAPSDPGDCNLRSPWYIAASWRRIRRILPERLMRKSILPFCVLCQPHRVHLHSVS